MKKIKIYATRVCPYCQMALMLLKKRGVDINSIEKILIDIDPQKRQEMMDITNRKTVPQVFIGEYHVGGFDDLQELDKAGKLTEMLM